MVNEGGQRSNLSTLASVAVFALAQPRKAVAAVARSRSTFALPCVYDLRIGKHRKRCRPALCSLSVFWRSGVCYQPNALADCSCSAAARLFVAAHTWSIDPRVTFSASAYLTSGWHLQHHSARVHSLAQCISAVPLPELKTRSVSLRCRLR